MAKNWIQGAIKYPGALTAKAKRAGKSVHAYAEQMKHAPGTTGKQARLALTLERLRKNPDRLQDAVIVVRGKKVKGKAKYDSKAKRVRVFVPPAAARKANPELREYKVILSSKYAERNVVFPVYATSAIIASREASKRKGEFVDKPKMWKIVSVSRVTR